VKENAAQNAVAAKENAIKHSTLSTPAAEVKTAGADNTQNEPPAVAKNDAGVTKEVAANNGGKKSADHARTASVKKAGTGSADKQDVAKVDKTTGADKAIGAKDVKGANAEQPVASIDGNDKTTGKISDKKAVAKNGTHRNKAGKQATQLSKNNMVVSSGAPVVKTDIPTGNEAGDHMPATTGNTKTSVAKHGKTAAKSPGVNGTRPTAANTKVAGKVPGAAKATSTSGHPVSATSGNGGGAGKVAVVTPPVQRGKHTIQRLIVNQRLIPCGVHQSIMHLDTVSMESVTEEYDLASAKTDANNDTRGMAKGDEVDDTSPIITTNDRFGSDAKDNNYVSKGKMALEGLGAAFNEIKFKAGHAVFSAGITGGINGTFFGPNNFKGFQFGVTGKLAFGDQLALMGELKYFNRINNNYSLNDDYYQYTPVAGGFSRELVKNPYSISNLQSIEMPISLQFSKSNFNFMIGPNISYAFGINAGEYPTVITGNTPTIVGTPGNDNTPKIKANDFNSRFGIGYLVGVSYQLSPKVYLDLRDVQTFWDNSKTGGSKYISSQLYRSPSFQLSIGYRFGGNKHKD